jgi:Sec-independent protein translocase protein TatA
MVTALRSSPEATTSAALKGGVLQRGSDKLDGMPSIDPSKIMVVLVVALIVLGPDKLPRLARQLGEAWAQLSRWRERVEGEMRDVFPDLPTPTRIVEAARSPLKLLDQLAAEHSADFAAAGGTAPSPKPDSEPKPNSEPASLDEAGATASSDVFVSTPATHDAASLPASEEVLFLDDPCMN